MLSDVKARVHVTPPRSLVIETTPGRRLQLHGGAAKVTEARDLPALLRRDDLVIEVMPDWVDFLPGWIAGLGETKPVRARLILPEGCSLIGQHPRFHLARAEAEEPTQAVPRRRREAAGA